MFELTEGASELELDSLKVEVAIKAGIFYKFTLQSGDLVIRVVIQKRLDGALRTISTNIGASFGSGAAQSGNERRHSRKAPQSSQQTAHTVPSLVDNQNGKTRRNPEPQKYASATDAAKRARLPETAKNAYRKAQNGQTVPAVPHTWDASSQDQYLDETEENLAEADTEYEEY